jgi:hypothetical protein
MSYKVFVNGDPLPASEVNDYLMNQVVIAFADSTARSASLPIPVEGQVTYMEDSNKYQYYSGTQWLDLLPGGLDTRAGAYTTVAGDLGRTIVTTSATPVTITIANVLANPGDRIDFIQDGAGQMTFAPGSGVTLRSADSMLKMNKRYGGASVVFAGSGVYYLIGNLVA